MSDNQLQAELNWLPIKQEITLATHKTVHRIINQNIPAGLAQLMPTNKTSTRLAIHQKLAPKPRYLNKTKLTQSTLRNRAYAYNVLPGRITAFKDKEKFKKWAKKFMQNPEKVPKKLNEQYIEDQIFLKNQENQ